MVVGKLCNSGSRKTVQLDHCCDDRRLPVNSSSSSGECKSIWIVLLMKLQKHKRKIFKVTYDPYTYSQNFDQGLAWDEPDNFSRSFSIRFSDPNRIFLKKSQA